MVYGDDMLQAIVPNSAKPFNFHKAYGLSGEQVGRAASIRKGFISRTHVYHQQRISTQQHTSGPTITPTRRLLRGPLVTRRAPVPNATTGMIQPQSDRPLMEKVVAYEVRDKGNATKKGHE